MTEQVETQSAVRADSINVSDAAAGKVPYGVAQVAAEALRPCIALAGRVLIGSREMRAVGIESAYAVVDLVGEEASFGDPAGSLAALAERTARTWSH